MLQHDDVAAGRSAAADASRPSFPYGDAVLDLPASWKDLLVPAVSSVFLDGRPGPGDALVAPASLPLAEDPERLFWFRWITGHQLTFFVWRALETALAPVRTSRSPAVVNAYSAECARLLRCYSSLFVYTASCPRDLYNGSIRPYMRLTHAAFSGSWAAEWESLEESFGWLLRLARSSDDDAAVSDAASALRENRRLHMAVARKLVPGGHSVLQEFKTHVGQDSCSTRDRHFMYDAFFLVRRGPTTLPALLTQAADRAGMVLADLKVNGLYPKAWDSTEEYDLDDREKANVEVYESTCAASVEDGIVGVLRTLAGHARD